MTDIQYNKEHMAKVYGSSVPVSPKKAIEISNLLRNKSLAFAKATMNDVVENGKAIPYTRFNKGVGHKTGIGPGRYPKKSASEVLKLLNSLEANAQFKGLDTNNLVIVKMVANKSSKVWRYGRMRRRIMKRSNIEILAEESKKDIKKKSVAKKPEVKKEEKITTGPKKPDVKKPVPEVKKEEKKPEVKKPSPVEKKAPEEKKPEEPKPEEKKSEESNPTQKNESKKSGEKK
ncbi:50S ribosomal protein L22 [Nanoarchaeota archaeon]